jgi:hypothetical protein
MLTHCNGLATWHDLFSLGTGLCMHCSMKTLYLTDMWPCS